ncbi:MAG: asparagine synthase (glutamine-hydrolyzing) [Firmicutes bacterium]|nr:asparagine synthase (glutamine-hydrolyzing) [Bacillota bacterium]
MSGFCGFAGCKLSNAESIITAMLDTIAHRGQNIETYSNEKVTLGLRSEDEHQCNLTLVFDGEIYNKPDLCARLEEKGYIFNTSSYAEVILRLYEEYGTEMLQHLRGIFSFALYDAGADKFFCARDTFGVKPFYYTRVESGFIFGSEIKSFFPHPNFEPIVNTEALGQYLTFQYSVLNETFFKGVYKLPAGHYLIWENETIQITRYNRHLFAPVDTGMDIAVENIDNAVQDTVARQMFSPGGNDEIGSFLSGGVDSGYVSAVFSENGGNRTFTVGFDYDNYNEIEYAKTLSDQLGLENVSKIISTDEYWESLSKIQYYMDEPLADPASVAFYFACREASKHVKIAFSGEGADEFFGGYNIYKEPLSLQHYTRLPLSFRRWIASVVKKLPSKIKGRNFLIRGAKAVEERFIGNAYIFSQEERDRLLKFKPEQSPMDITRPYYDRVKHEDDITKMQFLDIHLWLTDDILLQADKMSAVHGLKLRVPLMDREVFNAALRLPVKYRVTKKETKVAFRKAAAKHLPPETAWRKKLGFPVPIRIWLREEKYYNIVKSHFTGDAAEKYFHIDGLMSLLDEHYKGKQDNSRKIWTVYVFLLWHEEFIRGGTS